MAGIRVGKGSCLVIPVHLLPARAARRITLEGNIKIHLDFPVFIPVRQVNAVQAYIRYGAGMPRLAALVLACGQRECGIGQRIIQFVRHGFAALHADEIFRVQRERIRRIFGKSLVLFSLGNDGRSGGFGFPDIHRFGGGSGGLRRILRALDVLGAVMEMCVLCVADEAVRVHGFHRASCFAGACMRLFFDVFRLGHRVVCGLDVLCAVVQVRTFRAAHWAVFVHVFRPAGRFADACGGCFPAVLGKGRDGQRGEHHDKYEQDAEQSFLHSCSVPFSSVRFPYSAGTRGQRHSGMVYAPLV